MGHAKIIADYMEAFRAANPKLPANEIPNVRYEAGWMRLDYGFSDHAKYRTKTLIEMTENLKSRAANTYLESLKKGVEI